MSEPASYIVDPADALKLREIVAKLARLGYSERSINERLGLEDIVDLQWRHVPMYCSERLAARDPLALAMDLFLLQGALSEAELQQLFVSCERDLLVEAGLLAIDEAQMARARASLFPVGDHLIFSDQAWPELPHPGYAKCPSDHVMAIGRDSRNLALCTTRRRFQSALDLCTGSGIHALLVSGHAERVTAVDINPRAANCTRFNAQVSGITNLEVALGDLYECVADEKFDLITANPPFVPSPSDAVQFRDGGRSGEDVQKRIVAGLSHHLAAGGMAQIVTELGERNNEPLVQRLREWLNGAPMDIYMLRVGDHSATEYAVGHAKADNHPDLLRSIDEWACNLRAQGYVRIVSLIISFQWSDRFCGPPWERVDASLPPLRAGGAEIDATFLVERATRRADWREILKRSWLRQAGPTALFDAQVLGAGIPSKVKATLLGRSLRIEYQLDPIERQVLDWLNEAGSLSVSDLIGILSENNLDEHAALEAIRSLLRHQLVKSFEREGDVCQEQMSGEVNPSQTHVFLPTGVKPRPSRIRSDSSYPSRQEARSHTAPRT